MIAKFIRRYNITVGRYEPRPTEDRFGMASIKVGEDDFEIEVSIDLDSIVNYQGRKAVQSKSGRSRDGYVTVKRIRKVKAR